MPIPWLPIGVAIALKEVADFVQIGLVAWQSGKKLTASRGFSGGTVTTDGGTVRVQMGDLSFSIPIEDAAAQAGVAGAAGRGPKPPLHPLERVPFIGRLASIGGPPLGRFIEGEWGRVVGKGVDGAADAVVVGPNPDRKAFTLREYVGLQEEAARKGGARKDTRERELAALEQQHKERLGALDAQIAREQIAGRTDVTRLEVGGRLLLQREELVGRFGLQTADLAAKHTLGAQDQAAEMARLQAKLGADLALQQDEQTWKTTERVSDQRWKEKQAATALDQGYYYKNAAADRAVSRSLEAARGIVRVLRDAGVSQQAVVSFASAFGRGVS